MEQIRRPAGGDEYLSALSSVRLAKNCFLAAVAVSIVVQMATFAVVRWVGVLDRSEAVGQAVKERDAHRRESAIVSAAASGPARPAARDVPVPATAPEVPPAAPAGPEPEAAPTAAPAPGEVPAAAASAPGSKPPGRFDPPYAPMAQQWAHALRWVLPVTKFLGLGGGMLLCLSLLLAVNLALAGRTGGVAGFVGAFFWALGAWLFLIPWQQILVGTWTAGALFSLGDLVAATTEVTWAAGPVPVWKEAAYYGRFVAYPVAVLLALLVVQARFALGYKRMTLSVAQTDLGQSPDRSEKL